MIPLWMRVRGAQFWLHKEVEPYFTHSDVGQFLVAQPLDNDWHLYNVSSTLTLDAACHICVGSGSSLWRRPRDQMRLSCLQVLIPQFLQWEHGAGHGFWQIFHSQIQVQFRNAMPAATKISQRYWTSNTSNKRPPLAFQTSEDYLAQCFRAADLILEMFF